MKRVSKKLSGGQIKPQIQSVEKIPLFHKAEFTVSAPAINTPELKKSFIFSTSEKSTFKIKNNLPKSEFACFFQSLSSYSENRLQFISHEFGFLLFYPASSFIKAGFSDLALTSIPFNPGFSSGLINQIPTEKKTKKCAEKFEDELGNNFISEFASDFAEVFVSSTDSSSECSKFTQPDIQFSIKDEVSHDLLRSKISPSESNNSDESITKLPFQQNALNLRGSKTIYPDNAQTTLRRFRTFGTPSARLFPKSSVPAGNTDFPRQAKLISSSRDISSDKKLSISEKIFNFEVTSESPELSTKQIPFCNDRSANDHDRKKKTNLPGKIAQNLPTRFLSAGNEKNNRLSTFSKDIFEGCTAPLIKEKILIPFSSAIKDKNTSEWDFVTVIEESLSREEIRYDFFYTQPKATVEKDFLRKIRLSESANLNFHLYRPELVSKNYFPVTQKLNNLKHSQLIISFKIHGYLIVNSAMTFLMNDLPYKNATSGRIVCKQVKNISEISDFEIVQREISKKNSEKDLNFSKIKKSEDFISAAAFTSEKNIKFTSTKAEFKFCGNKSLAVKEPLLEIDSFLHSEHYYLNCLNSTKFSKRFFDRWNFRREFVPFYKKSEVFSLCFSEKPQEHSFVSKLSELRKTCFGYFQVSETQSPTKKFWHSSAKVALFESFKYPKNFLFPAQRIAHRKSGFSNILFFLNIFRKKSDKFFSDNAKWQIKPTTEKVKFVFHESIFPAKECFRNILINPVRRINIKLHQSLSSYFSRSRIIKIPFIAYHRYSFSRGRTGKSDLKQIFFPNANVEIEKCFSDILQGEANPFLFLSEKKQRYAISRLSFCVSTDYSNIISLSKVNHSKFSPFELKEVIQENAEYNSDLIYTFKPSYRKPFLPLIQSTDSVKNILSKDNFSPAFNTFCNISSFEIHSDECNAFENNQPITFSAVEREVNKSKYPLCLPLHELTCFSGDTGIFTQAECEENFCIPLPNEKPMVPGHSEFSNDTAEHKLQKEERAFFLGMPSVIQLKENFRNISQEFIKIGIAEDRAVKSSPGMFEELKIVEALDSSAGRRKVQFAQKFPEVSAEKEKIKAKSTGIIMLPRLIQTGKSESEDKIIKYKDQLTVALAQARRLFEKIRSPRAE
ncbi:MAG: hypothetical protein HQM10_00565 [Candidatus Riflebacteria bacterium]|nr:hypothetical protein [Candidatus Riflebacteria bacterium]